MLTFFRNKFMFNKIKWQPAYDLILIVLKALLGSLAENWAFIGVTVLGIIAKDEFACSFMRKVEFLHFFMLVHFGLCRDFFFTDLTI